MSGPGALRVFLWCDSSQESPEKIEHKQVGSAPPTSSPGTSWGPAEREGGRKPEVWRGLLTQEAREVAEKNRVWNSSPPPPPAACQEGIILDYPAVSSHPRGRPQPGRGIHFRGCGSREERRASPGSSPSPRQLRGCSDRSWGGGVGGDASPSVGERPRVAPAGSPSPPWGDRGAGGAPSPIQGAQPRTLPPRGPGTTRTAWAGLLTPCASRS